MLLLNPWLIVKMWTAYVFSIGITLGVTLAQVFSCKFCEIFKNIFFHGIPPVAAFEKLKAEAVIWRCSVKKVFFKISLHSQQNTCARVSFLLKQSLKKAFSYEFCEQLSTNIFFTESIWWLLL